MMSRRISLFLGTVLLVLALCCAVALADTVESGTLNDGVTWTLDSDGVLSFSGSGEIRNSLDDSLRQKAKTVFFGPGITYIEPGRFSYSYNLTSFTVDPANPNYTAVNGILYNKNMTELVECPTAKTGDLTVPATVTAIDHDAFIGNHLLSVTLPDSLETIGSQAFWNSEYLTEIALPASYTGYSTSVFNGCDELTMFTVAEANTEYAALNGLLYSKDLHTLIRVPGGVSGALTTAEGVTEIYSCAFERCGKLTSVTLSEGVTAIGGGAFSYSAVTTVSLPASLTTISRGAFNNADALENVYYAGTKADWSNVQVGEQNVSLQSLIIHCQDGNITPQPMTGNIGAEEDEVTYILTVDGTLTVSGAGRWTSWAFMNNKKIKTAVLESGVTEIGWGAFDWCENLTGIVIPNTVTEIMFEAFYGCKSLETVTIPASVTELGNEVFDACSALQSITFGGTLAEWQALTEETDNRKLADISIYCSDGSIEQKWTGTCGENLTWELKNGVMTISGTGPMDNYSWDADHWENKEEIRSVVIEEGVTSVGELAFYTCPVASVSLPDSLTEIGSCAFYVCDLESVIIPKNVETIGTWAFSANSDLTAIQVAEGNANFSSYDGALYNKDQTVLLMCPAGKKSVSLPNTVVNIDGAFQACHNLISVVLPEGITGIGSSTFNNLNDLTGITIPASVTVIEYNAFGNCPSLTDITYAGTKAAWAQINIGAANDPLYGEACTVHCTDGDIHNEKTMEWRKENGVLTITGTGPMDNYELQAGRQAPWRFESSDVTEIQIGQGMTSIGNYAFRYMMTLTKITIPDTVKYVGQFAFDNCSSLADVYFGGTREQWHGINITTGNTMLNAAEIHCTDGDIEGMPKLATPNITVKPTTIQLGAAFTVDAEYDEEANYSTLMVYDGNGRYIGFQNTAWDQIVYTRWPNDCEPGTYRATLTSYRQGYRNSDPAEFEFTVTAGERPAAPTVTVSPATPVKKEAITFLFDGTYDRINIDLYRADGSRYSGNDAANTDRYVWPNGLAAGNWIVQASVCVNNVWSLISETPFTVTEEEAETKEVTFTASAQELYTGQYVDFHAECAGAAHIAILQASGAQVLEEADGEECDCRIAYNVSGIREFYAVATFADGKTAESKRVSVEYKSAGQLDAPTFEVNKTTFAPGEDIVVTRTNTVANEESCGLFLSTPDHTQTIYNGIWFEGNTTLTVAAPDQPGEYILSVLVMASGWNNNQTDLTITVADPNKPILTASTDKDSYDYGEAAELTAVISWANGSTEGLAEAYPDASISATLITDSGEPVQGFIVQSRPGLQLQCNFPMADDDMAAGYYRILVETDVEDLSVMTNAFYYTADKSHLPDPDECSVELSLAPATFTLYDRFVMTATVTDEEGNPVSGIKVLFEVLDSNGEVVDTFFGNGNTGLWNVTKANGITAIDYSANPDSECFFPAGKYEVRATILGTTKSVMKQFEYVLKELHLPASLQRIEAEAFAGMPCQAVYVPETCESIGEHAFQECKDLIYIRVPTGAAIAENAFEGCNEALMIDRK